MLAEAMTFQKRRRAAKDQPRVGETPPVFARARMSVWRAGV